MIFFNELIYLAVATTLQQIPFHWSWCLLQNNQQFFELSLALQPHLMINPAKSYLPLPGTLFSEKLYFGFSQTDTIKLDRKD